MYEETVSKICVISIKMKIIYHLIFCCATFYTFYKSSCSIFHDNLISYSQHCYIELIYEACIFSPKRFYIYRFPTIGCLKWMLCRNKVWTIIERKEITSSQIWSIISKYFIFRTIFSKHVFSNTYLFYIFLTSISHGYLRSCCKTARFRSSTYNRNCLP